MKTQEQCINEAASMLASATNTNQVWAETTIRHIVEAATTQPEVEWVRWLNSSPKSIPKSTLDTEYRKAMSRKDEQIQNQCDRIHALTKDVGELRAWKESALVVESWWAKVDNFVRNHRDATIGGSVADTALRMLTERDALKHKLAVAQVSLNVVSNIASQPI